MMSIASRKAARDQQRLEIAIGYEPITASFPDGGGGLTHMSAIDRDRIVSAVLHAGFRHVEQFATDRTRVREMIKFKVGDRVQMLAMSETWDAEEGTVTEVNSSFGLDYCNVRWDRGELAGCMEDFLELISRPTPAPVEEKDHAK